jgi:hypothetical protein
MKVESLWTSLTAVASSLILVQSRSSLQLPLPLTGTSTPRSPRHSVTSSHTDTGSPDVAHPIVTLRGGSKAKAPPKTLPKSPRKAHGAKGNAPVVAVGSGTATVASEIFNLVKAIVGVGVLSLPAGIAAFGDAPSALVPALALIAIIGVLSGYGFAIIGRVCK